MGLSDLALTSAPSKKSRFLFPTSSPPLPSFFPLLFSLIISSFFGNFSFFFFWFSIFFIYFILCSFVWGLCDLFVFSLFFIFLFCVKFEVFVVFLLFWFYFKKNLCVRFGLSMWNCGKWRTRSTNQGGERWRGKTTRRCEYLVIQPLQTNSGSRGLLPSPWAFDCSKGLLPSPSFFGI